MEHRKTAKFKTTPLPTDYLKMVSEVFSTNFNEGLKTIAQAKGAPATFNAHGDIGGEEIVLTVSLSSEKQLSAISVHASVDFDPKAALPTSEELLACCVDGIGTIFSDLFSPENIEQLLEVSLAALKNVPLLWTPIEVEKRTIFVRVDRANPALDILADEWLKKNDPLLKKQENR